jgi:hypothetical protein
MNCMRNDPTANMSGVDEYAHSGIIGMASSEARPRGSGTRDGRREGAASQEPTGDKKITGDPNEPPVPW